MRAAIVAGALLSLLSLASCQLVAGFDDRHLASGGGGGGAAGAAGAAGQGGAAGGPVALVGKQVPARPAPEAGSKSSEGPRLYFVLTGLSFGLLDDTPQWPTLGYNLDNSCDQGSKLCARSTSLVQGDDCTDNGVGQALKLALQLESRISKIEAGTNARLSALGRTLLLELGDVNPTKDGDDAYVPGHIHVLSPAEMDAKGNLLPRKLDPAGLPLPIEDFRLEEGTMPPARVHFPHGYLRNNVWVSGDLGEENRGPIYLPLSGEVSTPSQDQLGELPTTQYTMTVTFTDATLSAVSSSTVAGVVNTEALKNGLLPSFSEFQDCNPKAVSNALRFLDSYADMPGPGQDQADGCQRISVGLSMAWQKHDQPVLEVSKTPVKPTCPTEICSPGAARCVDGGQQICGAQASWNPPVACPADDPICVDGQCAHVLRLSASGSYTCALLSQGPPRCWGKGNYGNLGVGRSFQVDRPLAIGNLYDALDVVSFNSHHACALRQGGKVSCWGTNTSGRVGQTFGDRTVEGPYEVPGINDAVGVALGDASSCALRQGGTVVCWGENLDGQVGNKNASAGTQVPLEVLLKDGTPLGGVRQISSGGRHACALTTKDELYCWGLNEQQQLGLLTSVTKGTTYAIPIPIPPGIQSVFAAQNGTFLIDKQQTLYATGDSSDGQLAALTGTGGQWVPLPGLQVQQVATGRFSHSLLRTTTGVYGSGHNDMGQLALPADQGKACGTDMDDCNLPGSCVLALTPVDPGGEVVDLVSGENHTCALYADRQVRCWGNYIHGESGDGTFQPACSLSPTIHQVKW
jgi:alpha-tubulin suppressor-like RCC1 family protein